MKINSLKTVISENKRRGAVVLLSLVGALLIASASGEAQPKAPKRITALQLGDAAEGARVTIVSDSALGDYEAFRRGDRFYVRIPLADFTSIPPSFRADGFEDVQVQKVGDSLMVSFRLQPGASAHVDQRGNRLEVIFSAPNRVLRNSIANGSSRATTVPGYVVPRNAVDRGPDAAGPMPPGTAPAYSRGGATYGAGETYGEREGRNPRLPFNPSGSANRNFGNATGSRSTSQSGQSGNQSAFGNNASKSPSPLASPFATPSSVLGPSPSASFPAASGATPSTSGSYQPTFGASPAASPVSAGTSSWRTRSDAAMRWMSANRLATLLGALILLALILFLVLAVGRRRKEQAKAKRLKAPKVQPKIEPAAEPTPESLQPLEPRLRTHREPSHTPAVSPQPREYPSASAAAVGSAQNSNWTRPQSSTNSSAMPSGASSEEQEREVFEL